jgi:hypothetical protein
MCHKIQKTIKEKADTFDYIMIKNFSMGKKNHLNKGKRQLNQRELISDKE